MALDGLDGPVDVGDGLPLGDLTDEDLAVLGEGDDGRGRPCALGVRDDGGLATLEDGHDGVGRTQVDADGTGHGCYLHDELVLGKIRGFESQCASLPISRQVT